jgi:HAD superfamily hydrolase (TIGR01509 family)
MVTIKYIIFDWGNTTMRDLNYPGPMRLWPRIENIPGIIPVLQQLKPDYGLAIATSAAHSSTQDMKEALRMGGLEPYFDYFFSSWELGVAKPDPEFFTLVITSLACEPLQALSVGDKYSKDVEAAKKAGLHAIWFNEARQDFDPVMADAMIFTMNELPLKIKEIQEQG